MITQHCRKQNIIPYSQKFWWRIYFGRLVVLRATHQYFIHQKLHTVMSSLLQNHSLCTNPAARRASLIVDMDFTIESCIRGHCFSKEFCTAKEKSWLVCQREEGNQNDVYTVVVKTNGAKTVEIKRNNDLYSFQLHFIDFVLTERKPDHGR